MQFAGPQIINRSSVLAPAGAIVGFDGPLSAIPSLWLHCNGANGTPDTTNRYIIGTDDATYVLGGTGGTTTNQVNGTTATAGAHAPQGSAQSGAGQGISTYTGLAGDHAHALSGSIDWRPPSREIIFIMAVLPAPLPANAVVWRFAAAAPSRGHVLATMQDRFALGVGTDSRAQVGTDNRSVSLTVGTAGAHMHPGSNSTIAGSYATTPLSAGDHIHTSFNDTISVAKPPYLALLPIMIDAPCSAFPQLVLAYYGSLAALSAKWVRCGGANGSPDARGRIPIGAGGTLALGAIGGQSTPTPVTSSAAAPSATVEHSHASGTSYSDSTYLGDHDNYSWTHGHTGWTGTANGMPPWLALHFIMFKG